MIGFVVESLDVHANVDDINYLLDTSFKGKINTTAQIIREQFIEDFDFHYSSTHLTTDDLDLKLYHLMFTVFTI